MTALPQVARISIKDILFPRDFSQASEAALSFALKLARIYGSRVQVAHVIIPEPCPRVLSPRVHEQDSAWNESNNDSRA